MSVPKSEYISEAWKDGLFRGKVVFCTGGAGSICSTQVRALVYLGADACIIGRNVEKTEAAAVSIATARKGARVIGIGAVDVRNMDSLQKAADRCAKELGGIDFVIAGAAGNFLAPISQLSSNAFKSVMDIDVLGSYNCMKATLPYLLESVAKHKDGSTGKTIFISATMHYVGAPLQTHAAVAKAGVDALSANLAIEYGPRGLSSNIIAPGPIHDTDGMARLSRKEDIAESAKRIPSGRWGTKKNIADATIFLFSDAGSYVNGAVLAVDGGAWRTHGGNPGVGFKYPDFLLGDGVVTGVKGAKGEKKSKL